MDPAVLLQPKSDDSPSGGNLEYDPVFTEMELAAQPGEERQIGDRVTEAEDPDYGEVAEKALAVLEQSHDLRAAVYLADAVLHTEGMAGFADVTGYIRGCLEDFWDSCHPELDEDDDNDPTMRVNAVQGLCGQPGGLAGPSPVYRSVRRAALTDSRSFGRLSMRDIEIAEGQVTAPEGMENIPDTAAVSAAFLPAAARRPGTWPTRKRQEHPAAAWRRRWAGSIRPRMCPMRWTGSSPIISATNLQVRSRSCWSGPSAWSMPIS